MFDGRPSWMHSSTTLLSRLLYFSPSQDMGIAAKRLKPLAKLSATLVERTG